MRRLWMAVLAYGIASMALGAGTWVPVPPAESGGAHFERGPEPGTIIAKGGHGAKMVVMEAAVIKASAGAALKILEMDGQQSPLEQRVVLIKGAFVVHVGSTPLTLVVGGATISIRSASLLLISDVRGWLCNGAEVWEGGSIDVIRPKQDKLENGEEDLQIDYRLDLKQGDSCRLPVVGKPKMVTGADAGRLFSVIAKIFPVRQEKALSASNIEDQQDLLPPKNVSASDDDSPEIDGIEIELDADCVEVCVD